MNNVSLITTERSSDYHTVVFFNATHMHYYRVCDIRGNEAILFNV